MGLEELRERLRALKGMFGKLGEAVDGKALLEEERRLVARMSQPDFWQKKDADRSVARLKTIRNLLEMMGTVERLLNDAEALVSLLQEEPDEQMLKELGGVIKRADAETGRLRVALFLSGEHDRRNAFLFVHAGAGGVEACDWAQMLLRMYLRFLERRGFEVSVVDMQHAEEAGIKSATIYVKGVFAFGTLRGEAGVHRLVRNSPFDAQHRRHTSFASVEVLPEFDEDIKIEIRKEDLKIETYRASGPGGQHDNVTDSAVRITHIPTGIVVTCQNERSQHANRRQALAILKARLYEREQKRRQQEVERLRGVKGDAAWGNQIRSYILQPYTLIKDHRTGFETSNAQAVLDGEIDAFVEAFLHWDYKRRLQTPASENPNHSRADE
ncbi:MAG: peptide chain release factor 2 [Planctomycetota bacterium]|nr:MAG: peptide chain release factor 2 [Planctomycetota bacterium]